MDITIPKETSEWVEVPVLVDDVPTSDFQVAVTRWPTRPVTADWQQATVVGDAGGVVLAGLEPGTHQVWVRIGGAVVAAGSVWVNG